MIAQLTNPRVCCFVSTRFRRLAHASPVAKAIVLIDPAALQRRPRLYAGLIRKPTRLHRPFANVPAFVIRKRQVLANCSHAHMSFSNLASLGIYIGSPGVAE